MANLFSINSVGESLVRFLRDTYPEPLRTDHSCEFRQVSSAELAAANDMETAVTLYLYRVKIDEHMRNTPPPARPAERPLPLSVALHFLVIIWADDALAEQTITAWVMSQLNQHPILDQSNLSAAGGWAREDVVHFLPFELSNEDLMRVWDALEPSYRLSIPYVARVVRIDPDEAEAGVPVVASRMRFGGIDETAD
ncbi:MAG: DUF4255 domain-containing protein [Halieaceae bacterium]|jgi:hypothetical protein|nr:DUF4255 domain-containing protein [Halieaceae bacterium]